MRLIFNRIGVYVSMTHILLPFMILPLYSVMKGDPADLHAGGDFARRHAHRPSFASTCRRPCPASARARLLVFILALGYYITPALLGGADDQMISYYIAFYTTDTVNWGMACALGDGAAGRHPRPLWGL